MAAPLIPLLARLFAGGGGGSGMTQIMGMFMGGGFSGRGGGLGNLLNMFGGGNNKPVGPPPLPSDPDFFVKNEAYKKQKGAGGVGGFGSRFGGFGGLGGFGSVDMGNPVITLVKHLSLLKREIKDVGMQTIRGTVSLKFLGEMMNKIRELVPLDTIKQLGDSMGAFVGKLNPALVEIFHHKFDNLMATIGKPLMPIFQELIKYTESWSQVVASMTPVFQPLFDSIKRLVKGEANRLPVMFERMAPLIQLVVDSLAFLVDRFNELLNVYTSLATYTSIIADRWKATGQFIYNLAKPLIILGNALLKVTGFVTGFIKALFGFGKGGLVGATNSRYDPKKKPETAIRDVSTDSVASFSAKAFDLAAKQALMNPEEKEDPMQYLSFLPDIKSSIEAGTKVADEIRTVLKDIKSVIETVKALKDNLPSVSGVANVAQNGIVGISDLINFLGRQVMRSA